MVPLPSSSHVSPFAFQYLVFGLILLCPAIAFIFFKCTSRARLINQLSKQNLNNFCVVEHYEPVSPQHCWWHLDLVHQEMLKFHLEGMLCSLIYMVSALYCFMDLDFVEIICPSSFKYSSLGTNNSLQHIFSISGLILCKISCHSVQLV